jgi:hypothetical protein
MPDSQLSRQCSGFPCNGEGIVGGIRYNNRTGKTIGNRPAEMFWTSRGVQKDYLVFKEPHVPEDCGKKGVLGAEAAGTCLPDSAHHEHPQVSGNRHREPVHHITHIGIEGEQPSRGYSWSGTRFFAQVLHTLADWNNPLYYRWRDAQGHREILLGVAVNGKYPEPLLCKQVGEEGGDGGLADPAFAGDNDLDPVLARMEGLAVAGYRCTT